MVYPQTIYPSINWARHRVTTLIKTNALPLSQCYPANCLKNGEKKEFIHDFDTFAVNCVFH